MGSVEPHIQRMKINANTLSAICKYCQVATDKTGTSLSGSALLFQSLDGNSKWSSFNGDVWASVSMPRLVEEDTNFATPLLPLASWMKNIPSDASITLQLRERELVATAVKPGHTRASFRFPLISLHDVMTREGEMGDYFNYAIDADYLRRATRMAAQIGAAKTGDEILQSIHYQLKDGRMIVQAANGHMAVSSRKSIGTADIESHECLVDGRTIAPMIAEAQSDENGEVFVGFNNSGFMVSSVSTTTLFPEGAQFSSGCSVIAKDPIPMEKYFDTSKSPRSWFMGKEGLSSSIRRCLIDADTKQDNGKIKLTPITVEDEGGPVLAMEYRQGDTPIAREQILGSLIEREGMPEDSKAGAIYISGLYLDRALGLFEGRTIYFNDGGFEVRQKPIILSDSPVETATHKLLIMPMGP